MHRAKYGSLDGLYIPDGTCNGYVIYGHLHEELFVTRAENSDRWKINSHRCGSTNYYDYGPYGNVSYDVEWPGRVSQGITVTCIGKIIQQQQQISPHFTCLCIQYYRPSPHACVLGRILTIKSQCCTRHMTGKANLKGYCLLAKVRD